MTTTERIKNLDALIREINKRVSHLRYEIGEVAELWDGLERVGGARDDNAAELLQRLQPHLAGLAQFCSGADHQIQRHVDDPFGRKTFDTMTLRESIGSNWQDIDSAKRLRGALLAACRRLRQLGHTDLADQWEQRVKRMPQRIGKEAINAVLLAANCELERLAIVDE